MEINDLKLKNFSFNNLLELYQKVEGIIEYLDAQHDEIIEKEDGRL